MVPDLLAEVDCGHALLLYGGCKKASVDGLLVGIVGSFAAVRRRPLVVDQLVPTDYCGL